MEDSNGLLKTPLLHWVFQLGSNAITSCTTVQDLVDGVFLNEVVCNMYVHHPCDQSLLLGRLARFAEP